MNCSALPNTYIFFFFTVSSKYICCSAQILCSFWGRSEPDNCISYQVVVQILAKGQVSHRLWKSVNHCPRSKQLSLFSRTLVFTCIYFPRKKLYFILKIFFNHPIGSGTMLIFNNRGLGKRMYILAIIKSKTLQ